MPRVEHGPYEVVPGRCTAPGALGALLTELRLARGWSQLRVAEQLCAASGVPTVSRHEVSRWERQQRIPGEFWLGWLATILDVPAADLHVAAAASRPATAAAASRPATAGDEGGAEEGDGGTARARQELLTSAHAWLVDPGGPVGPGWTVHPGPETGGAPVPEVPLDATGVARLRRLDDVVAGRDLLSSPAGRLALATLDRLALATVDRLALTRVDRLAPATVDRLALTRVDRLDRAAIRDRRGLALLAEAAQLTGWLHADAGELGAALRAYRLALTAAAGAGDRSLGGYLLGSASHLLNTFGDPRGGLLLARTGYLGARRTAPAGVRAVLLHRIALAAALCGRRRTGQAALDAADRAAGRHEPDRGPGWLYWLDGREFAAMTGRCLAALRRPLRAEALLRAALTRSGQPRTSAIYGAWLARTYLELGELERAAEVADAALLDAVRSGSARAAAELAGTGRRLAAYRTEPAGRRYATLAAAARHYLPPAPSIGPAG
ncbi:transcriptional regulator [Plantactinospora sp. WMMC1484]|uniref:transcriptional regulator n=1 Tax=Plantactinospora sp. WMMC1484 TaxID=3404122 RepID=UPI003BF5B5B6